MVGDWMVARTGYTGEDGYELFCAAEHSGVLWQALLDFVRVEGLVTRERVLERFDADGELQVTAVLHDLTESGLVFCSGSGKRAVYRVASDEELQRIAQLSDKNGGDELA